MAPALMDAPACAGATPVPDLHSAFDAAQLDEGYGPLPTQRLPLGELRLESGSIIVTDPLTRSRPAPLVRTAPPGVWPVEALRVGPDILLARVVFSREAPATWELATWPGQDVRSLRPGMLYGVPVGTATAAFIDAGSAQVLLGSVEATDALLAQVQGALPDAIVRVPAEDPRLITFCTAGSDGLYPVWWGLDDEGRAVELVFDAAGPNAIHRPTLPDDPPFRRAEARHNLEAIVAAAARGDGYGGFEGAIALGENAEDADEVVDDLLAALARTPDAPANASLLHVAKRLAAVSRFQPRIAAWLAQASPDAAQTFVLNIPLRVLEPHLAAEVARVVGNLDDDLKYQALLGLDSLEADRGPFIPVLQAHTHHMDPAIAEVAAGVLRAWGLPVSGEDPADASR